MIVPYSTIHAINALAFFQSMNQSDKTVDEWSLKIIEVYMSWYTYFISSNIVVMGWIFGSKIEDSVRPMLSPICLLFAVLNVIATVSTIAVAFTVKNASPNSAFQSLILWSALANSIATLGFCVVWLICRGKIKNQPHFRAK